MPCPHLDLLNPDTFNEGIPHDYFKTLREQEPVRWHEDPNSGVGYWVVSQYKDLEYVSKHPELFSSMVRSCLLNEPDETSLMGLQLMMLNMDPPQHLDFRRVVNKAFIPSVIDSKRTNIERVAKEIVDRVAPRGECEFVEEVAAELPLIVICDLMGVKPEDRKMIFHNTNIMVFADDPDMKTTEEEGLTAAAEIYGYGYKLAEEQKTNPQDNLTAMLLNGTVDGEKLTDDQFSSFFLLLLVAGNETTRTVTVNGMRLLMEHPDQLQMLVEDPSLIPNAIEEMLRCAPAVIAFRRTAMQDIELGGKHIKKGDKVVMYYPSANRDESIFDQADDFDITRKNAGDHRAFGIGQHFCLGTHLARLELDVIFREVIPRLRNPKFISNPKRLRSNFINGIKEMLISFDPE